eukprot:TRINITY_DN82_c0_g1_i2.p1 TRINITY_DN82_c0_g1~~TRINITY_DN82_c0_g1_i2.p1  ORF type:complete len:643 (+),score=242.29 TRINITY_DN82_c0_g1_i2:44-1972(+)
MRQLILLALIGASSAALLEAPMFQASGGDWDKKFVSWMEEGGEPFTGKEEFHTLRLKVVKRVASWASEQLKDIPSIYRILSWMGRASGIDTVSLAEDLESLGKSENVDSFVKKAKATAERHNSALRKVRKEGEPFHPLGEQAYPYWGFLPPFKTSVMPNGATATWTGKGCKNNMARAVWNEQHTEITISFNATECSVLHTGDFYMLATVDGAHFMKLSHEEPSHTIVWKAQRATTAVDYDLNKKGIRVFAFIHDEVQTMVDLLDTVQLFLQPEAGHYPDFPDQKVMEENIYFLSNYQRIKPFMEPRKNTGITGVNPDLIQTGDFIGVIRLDGLDPMLAWAMGSTTGHTTVAMRDANNELWITESTTNSSYWPVNGIQRTPYNIWIQQAKAAGYNAVWAPLDPAQRAKLNVTAMWDHFYKSEGLQYGYHTMLWGWIDTVKNNYPCLPPDFEACLEWNHIEILFPIAAYIVPSVGQLLYEEAWNKRLGTTGLTAAEMFMYAETQLNMSSDVIPTIVEQDSWIYDTTRYGKPVKGRSMVCCVFVCSMWKAGGLFGNDTVNCGELTNLDDYDLNIFDKTKMNSGRPEICQINDPENQNCQLVGPYTLNFNNYNEAPIYSHMAEKCPSWIPGEGPDYWGPGKQQGTC